jgi:hypothetical protein
MMRRIVNRFLGDLRRGRREALPQRVNQLTRLSNRELVRVRTQNPYSSSLTSDKPAFDAIAWAAHT